MHSLTYRRPIALNRALHRSLRLSLRAGDAEFASSLNSVPLPVAEFSRAASDDPIVFAGDDPATAVPAALLGLGAGENLFGDDRGHWASDVDVPAFLRRYPFGLAERAEDDGFTVCL